MGCLNIFLIRHGESVDNVAGIYAGSRDSPLTAHGVLQTRRLASHLATLTPRPAGKVAAIFTSTLQRAIRTAEAIQDAISELYPTGRQIPEVEMKLLPELRERDFGSDEGKKFGRSARAGDAESHASLRQRAQRFLEDHLAPIISAAAGTAAASSTTASCAAGQEEAAGKSNGEGKETEKEDVSHAIFVVAHGLILASLLTVLRSPELFALLSASASVDAPPVWSNTGYTRLVLAPVVPSEVSLAMSPDGPGSGSSRPRPRWPCLRLDVACVNNTSHLTGLKKTRGGIGSARFDDRQKTLTSFFGPVSSKKRKAVDDLEKWYVHPWSRSLFCSFYTIARRDETPNIHRPVLNYNVETTLSNRCLIRASSPTFEHYPFVEWAIMTNIIYLDPCRPYRL